MTQEALTGLFGWASLITVGVLLVSTVALVLMGDFAAKTHARMFKLEEQEIRKFYFQYLAQFKIAVIVFNLAPYFALRILA